MARYAALLRGINVGGSTMIKMEKLRDVFARLGFGNVQSYINSGNIAFDDAAMKSQNTDRLLASSIEAAIEKEFGWRVPVMIREQAEIGQILNNNPFDGEFENHKEMHVIFLKEEMPADKHEQLLAAAAGPERFAVKGREIYCHLPLGVAASLLGKGFIDKKLKITATARNWRTVQKLAEL